MAAAHKAIAAEEQHAQMQTMRDGLAKNETLLERLVVAQATFVEHSNECTGRVEFSVGVSRSFVSDC